MGLTFPSLVLRKRGGSKGDPWHIKCELRLRDLKDTDKRIDEKVETTRQG